MFKAILTLAWPYTPLPSPTNVSVLPSLGREQRLGQLHVAGLSRRLSLPTTKYVPVIGPSDLLLAEGQLRFLGKHMPSYTHTRQRNVSGNDPRGLGALRSCMACGAGLQAGELSELSASCSGLILPQAQPRSGRTLTRFVTYG